VLTTRQTLLTGPLNATSMMNNWWFRVAIHHSSNQLKFEHPTLAGVQPGGWMQRMKDEGKDILNPVFRQVAGTPVPPKTAKKVEVKMTDDSVNRKITLEELKAHSSPTEPWFVVAGEGAAPLLCDPSVLFISDGRRARRSSVYDGTGFLNDHPGGGESITLMAGEDATEDFMAIHSPQGKKMLVECVFPFGSRCARRLSLTRAALLLCSYHIGTLIQPASSGAAADAGPRTIDPVFLQKTRWKKTTLVSIEPVSHDSRVFRFALEKDDQPLGLVRATRDQLSTACPRS
jgi:nitrate reductase (NAD(P)H)